MPVTYTCCVGFIISFPFFWWKCSSPVSLHHTGASVTWMSGSSQRQSRRHEPWLSVHAPRVELVCNHQAIKLAAVCRHCLSPRWNLKNDFVLVSHLKIIMFFEKMVYAKWKTGYYKSRIIGGTVYKCTACRDHSERGLWCQNPQVSTKLSSVQKIYC